MISGQDFADVYLVATCVLREAEGEGIDGKAAVAWSVRNRVKRPCWWGDSWQTVILKPWQYSSFNLNDPNHGKYIRVPFDQTAKDCVAAALNGMFGTGVDPTEGATHYFDASMDSNPPKWSLSDQFVKTVEIGRLRFFKALT